MGTGPREITDVESPVWIELADLCPGPSRGVRLDPPGDGFPPLMVVYQNRLTAQAVENLRQIWKSAWEGPPSMPVLMDGGPEVYQLINGEWQFLRPCKADQ